MLLAVALSVPAAVVAPGGFAAAQLDGGDSGAAGDGTTTSTTTSTPTTTAPPGSSTTTTRPGGTAPGSSTTTTTTLPLPPSPVTIPPELADDPRAPILFDPGPGDGGEAPVFQGSFDPGTNLVLEEKVGELRERVANRMEVLVQLRADLSGMQEQVDLLEREIDALDEVSRANVSEAARAERALRDHTIDAFVHGSTDSRMSMVRTGDPVEMGVARELLDSVVESDQELLEDHEEAQENLDDHQQVLVGKMSKLQGEYAQANTLFRETLRQTLEDSRALQAYEAGAQVYVQGFVFPVQGEVEFIDSWGYPRMMGTSSAHWHQGTDIFAPMGTPLVASESGVLDRVGVAGLGGMRLWIEGDSGTHYYYAHLIAFADGMADGVRVNAGDVVGYVGDTGNAKGTPPHLHFEVHPGGGDAVNPYPLLKATYGTRPMVQVVEAPTPAEALAALAAQQAAADPQTIPPTTGAPPATNGSVPEGGG